MTRGPLIIIPFKIEFIQFIPYPLGIVEFRNDMVEELERCGGEEFSWLIEFVVVIHDREIPGET